LNLESAGAFGGDRSLVVDRAAERVDDASEKPVAHGNRENAVRLLDRVALFEEGRVAENDRSDLVLLEVERETDESVRELEELARHAVRKAVHTCDAVAGLEHASDFLDLGGRLPRLDLFA